MSRSVVLVAGMSGTGESTASPSWPVATTVWWTPTTRAGSPKSRPRMDPEPMWDLDRIGSFVDRHRAGWLFTAGLRGESGNRLRAGTQHRHGEDALGAPAPRASSPMRPRRFPSRRHRPTRLQAPAAASAARTVAATDLPVSADLEAGYGDVAATIARGHRCRGGRREPDRSPMSPHPYRGLPTDDSPLKSAPPGTSAPVVEKAVVG